MIPCVSDKKKVVLGGKDRPKLMTNRKIILKMP